MRKSAIFVGAWLALLAGVLALVFHGRGRPEQETFAPHASESSGVPEPSSTVLADAPSVPSRSPVPAIVARPEPARAASPAARDPQRKETDESAERPRASPTEIEFVLRLLRPDQQPLSNQEILVEILDAAPGHRHTRDERTTTDADGNARIVPGTSLKRWTAPALLVIAREGEDGLRGWIDLSPDLPRGRTDLGDVLLSPARLLVAGRALDTGGQALTSGSVEVQTPRMAGRWVFTLTRELASDGTFVLFDDPPIGPMRLVIRSQGHAPSDPVPFAAGASGVLVQVPDGGVIAGSILLPEGTSADDYSVHVRARDGWQSGATHLLDPHGDGSFEQADLTAGQYDVEVALRSGQRLALIQRVAVEGGKTAHDPRLQEIDLSAVVHALRVRVSLPDGSPVPRGTVCVLQRETRSWFRMDHLIVDGVAQLPALEGPQDLAVIVNGFRVVRLAQVAADQDVVLREPAIEVDLVLPPSIALAPGARLAFDLSVAPDDPDWTGTWWRPHGLEFDESRELHASFQLPGTYTLEFRLDGSPRDEPGIAGASRLTIDASSAGRTIAVEPDPVAYAGALGR